MDVNESGPSRAEQVDRLLEAITSGEPMPPAIDPSLRPLGEVASTMRDVLAPVPVGLGFERRLGARLAAAGRQRPGVQLRLSGRLIVTGAAVSSAGGGGVTAYAVWRVSPRQPAPRFLQR